MQMAQQLQEMYTKVQGMRLFSQKIGVPISFNVSICNTVFSALLVSETTILRHVCLCALFVLLCALPSSVLPSSNCVCQVHGLKAALSECVDLNRDAVMLLKESRAIADKKVREA